MTACCYAALLLHQTLVCHAVASLPMLSSLSLFSRLKYFPPYGWMQLPLDKTKGLTEACELIQLQLTYPLAFIYVISTLRVTVLTSFTQLTLHNFQCSAYSLP
jgi:hypothetical protein